MEQSNQPTREQYLANLFDQIAVTGGNLTTFSIPDRLLYYNAVCERAGLDPALQPFTFLSSNNKITLYCNRVGAQQLSRANKVSHAIVNREVVSGIFIVTAQAKNGVGPDERQTESIGAVPIEGLKGDNAANAMMKAETKAKRRATLDLLGLGIMDETELDTMPAHTTITADQMQNYNAGNNNQGQQQQPAQQAQQQQNTQQATQQTQQQQQTNNAGQQQQASTQANNTNPSKVSEFRRKYEDTKQLLDVLSRAADVKDIASLYYVNAEIIEHNPEVKTKFTELKNKMYQSKNNQPA